MCLASLICLGTTATVFSSSSWDKKVGESPSEVIKAPMETPMQRSGTPGIHRRRRMIPGIGRTGLSKTTSQCEKKRLCMFFNIAAFRSNRTGNSPFTIDSAHFTTPHPWSHLRQCCNPHITKLDSNGLTKGCPFCCSTPGPNFGGSMILKLCLDFYEPQKRKNLCSTMVCPWPREHSTASKVQALSTYLLQKLGS